MKRFLLILVLLCAVASPARPQTADQLQAPPPSSSPTQPPSQPAATPIPLDQQNSRQAKALLEQAIQALGGDAYLTIHNREFQGKTFGFHHGRPSGNGTEFWSFSEFPDKERVELTKQRDIAELYIGNKGYEITYKGPKSLETKDLEDYLRRHRFSLDTILRAWVNDPTVALLYDGNAIAAQHSALQVTLINSKDESVTLDFDVDTHLPVKKSFKWRDPVDRQLNLEEEVYDNYRLVQGVMTPYNVTRFFNEDMSNERFIFAATINQTLDETMFDPNSNYNPNKVPAKSKH
jgi:hypothetical protein